MASQIDSVDRGRRRNCSVIATHVKGREFGAWRCAEGVSGNGTCHSHPDPDTTNPYDAILLSVRWPVQRQLLHGRVVAGGGAGDGYGVGQIAVWMLRVRRRPATRVGDAPGNEIVFALRVGQRGQCVRFGSLLILPATRNMPSSCQVSHACSALMDEPWWKR